MRGRDDSRAGKPLPRVRNLEGETVLFHLGIEPPIAKDDSTSWNDWIGEFSGGPVRAIAANRPGYGQSDRHALAMSLDKRCSGVITLAGVGKYGQPDLDFLDGMGPENIDEFGAALQSGQRSSIGRFCRRNGGGDAPSTSARI